MSSLSTSTQIYLYQSSDLDNYAENYDKTKARAFCPVHGSDKQRSLNVDLTGENRGFAHCHNCHAVILLEDLNREAAQRIREKDEREQKGLIRPAPIRIRADPKPRKQTPEQSYDLPLLKKYHADMQRALSYERPSAYLKQRGIPLDVAVAQGLLYLPVIPARKQTPELKKLRAWYDHIIFPLSSPAGQGFIGRNLHLWTPGMDEKEHRDLLKAPETPIPPYMKTKPAGYFRFEITKEYEEITVVEGTFDALSCLLAGVHDVVGLGGVALDVKMLPRSVQRVRIALDNDVTGREKAEILKKNLLNFGIDVTIVAIPDDGRAEKDWNERWKLYGKDGLEVLLDRSFVKESSDSIPDVPLSIETTTQQEETELSIPEPEEYADSHASITDEDEYALSCSVCGADVEHYNENGIAFCAEHLPQLPPAPSDQAQQSEAPAPDPDVPIPADEECDPMDNKVVQTVEALFPGTIRLKSPDYTILDAVREMQEHHAEEHDYWSMIHSNAQRPPVGDDNKPFYTKAAWHAKLAELQNWRPDERLYAHYPGGYVGYVAMHSRGQGDDTQNDMGIAS